MPTEPVKQGRTHREIRQHYLKAFPANDVNRCTIRCPDCGGHNSVEAGGNVRCFHCESCGLIECAVTSPAMEDFGDD